MTIFDLTLPLLSISEPSSQTLEGNIERIANIGILNRERQKVSPCLFLEPEDAETYLRLQEQQAIREIRTKAVSRWLYQLPYANDQDSCISSISSIVDSSESCDKETFKEIDSDSDKYTEARCDSVVLHRKSKSEINPPKEKKIKKIFSLPWRRGQMERYPSIELSEPPMVVTTNGMIDLKHMRNMSQFSKKWIDEICDEETDGSRLNNICNGVIDDRPLRTIKQAILNSNLNQTDNKEISEDIDPELSQITVKSVKRPNVSFHIKYNSPEQMLVPPSQQVIEKENMIKSCEIMKNIVGVDTKHMNILKEKNLSGSENKIVVESDSNEPEVVSAPSGVWWLPNFCFGGTVGGEIENRIGAVTPRKKNAKPFNEIALRKKIEKFLQPSSFRYKLRRQLKSMNRVPTVSRMLIKSKCLRRHYSAAKKIENKSCVNFKKMETEVSKFGFPQFPVFAMQMSKNEYYNPAASCTSLSDLDCCMWHQAMTIPTVGKGNIDAERMAYSHCQNWLWDYVLCFLRI